MTALVQEMADPAALLGRVHRRFASAPGPAYRCAGGRDLDFGALYQASAVLAARLMAEPDTARRRPVVIWGHKDLRYPVAYWACLLAGMALVPVERDTPAGRLRQIVEQCGAGDVLIASDADGDLALVQAALQGLPCRIHTVDPAARLAGEAPTPAPRAPGDVAYIMFSSGTLGRPKGIQVTYGNLVDFIHWLPALLPEDGLQAVSGNIRHCFDVSLFELWVSWTRLHPLVALDHADFAHSTAYITRLAEAGTGLWVSTPSITRLMLKNPRFNGQMLPGLRVFLFCGEPLTRQIVAALFERFPGCRVVNTYGPTECTVAVTAADITPDHLARPGELPIGAARPGVQLRTSTGAPRGELLISGPCVARGYLNQPEKQAHAFPAPDCYRSGDWAEQDAAGDWVFPGRMDREVKIQGVRIDLNDVEAHIRSQPGVEDVVVEPYVLRGEPRALNAYVIGDADAGALERLARDLAAELPPYLVPRFWYAGFPAVLNANSKLDRSQLSQAADVAQHRHVHHV